jgi:nitroreductase
MIEMKNFLELVKARYSSRAYSDRKVEPEKVEYLLECARLAPSAVNLQPWHFIVVESEEKRTRLPECYKREWLREAPLFIVVCADKSQSWKRRKDGHDHADIDAAIATEHICLAATEQGLGSCWVCNFDVDLCSEILDIQGDLYPVAIIPIGYANDEPTEKKRKEFGDVVSRI